MIMLRVVDEYWRTTSTPWQDSVKASACGPRQSNPVDAYKQESLHMFEEMIAAIQERTVRRLYSVACRRTRRSSGNGRHRHTSGGERCEQSSPAVSEDWPQRPMSLRQRKEV